MHTYTAAMKFQVTGIPARDEGQALRLVRQYLKDLGIGDADAPITIWED